MSENLKTPSISETVSFRSVESGRSTSLTVAPGSGFPSESRTVPVTTVAYKPTAIEEEMSNVSIVFFIMENLGIQDL